MLQYFFRMCGNVLRSCCLSTPTPESQGNVRNLKNLKFSKITKTEKSQILKNLEISEILKIKI